VVILFAAGLFALDRAVDARRDLWEQYNPDDYAERLAGCRSRPRDVIIVGGSPVSEGLDPAHLIGMTWQGKPAESAYAMGLPGGTTSEFWHAVKNGICRPPRLLVYGITASDLNDSRHEHHGPYSLMTAGDWLAWMRSRPESAEWVTRHFAQGRLSRAWSLFRHRYGIRLWAAERAEGLFPGSFPDSAEEARVNREYAHALRAGNGYAPNAEYIERRLDEMKEAGEASDSFPFLDRYRLGSHLKYLHKLLDWCEANGVTPVLLDMPVAADLDERLYPEAFAAYRAALAAVERERGIIVLRGSREAVGFGDRHFADLIHLNGDGAAKLTRWLRSELERCVHVGWVESSRPTVSNPVGLEDSTHPTVASGAER
jgi:hypothetical protein